MKIILSPAKALNFKKKLPTENYSVPIFLKEASQINSVLKKQSVENISKLMNISKDLANLNWQRNQEWKPDFTSPNSRPAVFTFNGMAYTGLDAFSLPAEKTEKLQNTLRIISGLYGILKPLDLIQAYRLEMGTKLAIKKNKDLYQFWKKTITNTLNSELENGELLVNLASQEYSHAVDFEKIKSPVIHVEFKDLKNEELKTIAIYAKKARGMMTRYIIDNQAESISDLKGFNSEGYHFDDNLSQKNNLVFTR